MSGEGGGEGGAEGGEASDAGVESGTEGVEAASDVGVEAAETAENAYVTEVPADAPEAFWNHMESPDLARYEANAAPETDEEREARLRREAGAAARGLLTSQMVASARATRSGDGGQPGAPR
ncbi:hypothetical protein [Streptomyces sp. NBC_01233]|uniref:hypothetical protein n=1 Tax=Streptomyces sp. NBC_01233 TaxID=2903787 RepID=UPI002E157C82|nr:hypothetical protein OG332_07035 [Streptomyces sp. NBC_01233]